MQTLVEGIGAGGVHDHGGFGVLALEYHSVAYHADVADQAHQLDLVGGFRQHGGNRGIGYIHAEDQLVDGLCAHFFQSLRGFSVNLPAVAALDTVLYRQILSFPGGQIVFKVGIPGEEDMIFAVSADFGGNFFIQQFGTGKTQGAVHKIVLIINDKQIAVHVHSS